MDRNNMRRIIGIVLIAVLCVALFTGCAPRECKEDEKIAINVLLLPKFEIGTLDDSVPGEAELLYQYFCRGGEEFAVKGATDGEKLYYKNGVALMITGMSKVNAATTISILLADERFDFSNAYVLSVGCCGSATEVTTMGDVFIGTAVIDYDLGHHADAREITNFDENTMLWYHDSSYDNSSVKILDGKLCDKIYNAVKDVRLETTDTTRAELAKLFDNAEWATRDPKVLKGTVVTGDNYWKGEYDQALARYMTEFYGCPDPFVATEMEDVAIAEVLDRFSMLDRYVIIRDSVNLCVFMGEDRPETIWGGESVALSTDEVLDIFGTAMENGFNVTKAAVEAILKGEIE